MATSVLASEAMTAGTSGARDDKTKRFSASFYIPMTDSTPALSLDNLFTVLLTDMECITELVEGTDYSRLGHEQVEHLTSCINKTNSVLADLEKELRETIEP